MFSRREKVLLAVAALAVGGVIAAQLPGRAGSTATVDGKSALAHWKAAQRRVADASARLGKLTAPEAEITGRLMRAVQESGAAAGVKVVSMRPGKAVKTRSGCVEHSLETQAAGPFPGIARFMFNLEAKHPDLRIARVAMNANDSGSDSVNCAIVIAGYSPEEVKQ